MIVDGEEVTFHVWDTAGQEEFNALTRRYYRGASACVLAFATNNRDSFEAVRRWRDAVHNECGEEITTVLIQTKIDLIDEAQVSEQEAESLATEFGVPLIRVCSKDNIMVKEVFQHLASTYFGQQKHLEDDFASPITSIEELKKNRPMGNIGSSGAAATSKAGGGAGNSTDRNQVNARGLKSITVG